MRGAADVLLDRPGGIFVPFFVSLLLHALFVSIMLLGAVRAPASSSLPFDVELLRPEEAARRALARQHAEKTEPVAPVEPVAPPHTQIVSPPESPEGQPDHARLLSDRDSRAEEEMVKRGEPAPPAEPPRSTAKAAASERSPEKPSATREGSKAEVANQNLAPLPGLSALLPRPSDVIHDSSVGDGSLGKGKSGEGESPRDYASVTRPEL